MITGAVMDCVKNNTSGSQTENNRILELKVELK